MSANFLPICDLLFNFISVTLYFCALAFDILSVYTFYQEVNRLWTLVLALTIVTAILLSQILSLKWFYEERKLYNRYNDPIRTAAVVIVHLCGFGVLWRYSKLFSPVHIEEVKREMRDLCVLRMIHAFLESSTFLIVLGYRTQYEEPLAIVNYISISLSLFNLCWSLASFNKNVYQRDVHKLVLTWIGVIFQFIWRLGTLFSRILAFIIYSYAYGPWIFLVVGLHWSVMFLWLIFTHTGNGGKRTLASTFIISYIHIFDFLNFDWKNTKFKITIYYLIVFVENLLLTLLWNYSLKISLQYDKIERRYVLLVVVSSILSGLLFMVLYYRFFHVKKLTEAKEIFPKNNSDFNKRTSETETSYPENPESARAVFNCALNENYIKKKKLPRVIPVPPLVGNTTSGEKKFHAVLERAITSNYCVRSRAKYGSIYSFK
ncbi:XK-related protein 6 [Lepeophtheirus salmonis]|uniref:XK-related protein 6 n=1 Tax=Lepeophtheirus salmonis TaxID=72036 RepID=UPI001AEA5E72|nr:XK-related protein 6-like [Lepeophtheirus salmonis]